MHFRKSSLTHPFSTSHRTSQEKPTRSDSIPSEHPTARRHSFSPFKGWTKDLIFARTSPDTEYNFAGTNPRRRGMAQDHNFTECSPKSWNGGQ